MTLDDVRELAARLARENRARVYALTGPLGAGKTAFAQSFLRALGAAGPFTSPTFVIMKQYSVAGFYTRAIHMDCYRITPADLAALDYARLIASPRALFIIEWADRIRSMIPADALWIAFAYGAGENDRMIAGI